MDDLPTKADSQGLDELRNCMAQAIMAGLQIEKLSHNATPTGMGRTGEPWALIDDSYLVTISLDQLMQEFQAYAQNLSDDRVDAYHKDITDNEKKVWIYRKDLDERIAKARREGKLEAARHFKNYMISNSPFIEEIIDPYIAQLTKGDNNGSQS